MDSQIGTVKQDRHTAGSSLFPPKVEMVSRQAAWKTWHTPDHPFLWHFLHLQLFLWQFFSEDQDTFPYIPRPDWWRSSCEAGEGGPEAASKVPQGPSGMAGPFASLIWLALQDTQWALPAPLNHPLINSWHRAVFPFKDATADCCWGKLVSCEGGWTVVVMGDHLPLPALPHLPWSSNSPGRQWPLTGVRKHCGGFWI